MLSIPKILRRFFLRDRRLVADLSRCGWEALKALIRAAESEPDSQPAAIVATHSFGSLPERFHPHLHLLAPDGAFYLSACRHAQAGGKGLFRVASRFRLKDLERLLRHKVLRMLLDKGKISREIIRIMDRWRHSGFNVYCGPRIHPREKKALERLAAYLIRSSFCQERMEYLPEQAQVRYESKDGKEHKTYDALEWLAATCLPAGRWEPTYPQGASSRSATTVFYPMRPGENAGRMRGTMGSPPCWSRKSAQRHLEKTPPGHGSSRRSTKWIPWSAPSVPDKCGSSLYCHDPSFSQLPVSYENEFSQLPPAEWDF